MKIIILTICLFLASCAPEIVNKPVEVDVAVPVDCKVATIEHPAWATNGLQASATVYEKVQAILAELMQRIAYSEALEAANASCQ